MRVGLMVGSPQVGGTERQVGILAAELARRGIEVTVFFMVAEKNVRGPTIDFSSVRHEFLGLSRWNGFWKAGCFRRRLRRTRTELLHMFNLEAIEFGSRAAWNTGVRACVGSVRGILFSQQTSVADRLRKALAGVSRVTVNSKSTAQLLVEHDICPSNKIVFLPNGIHHCQVASRTTRTSDPPRVLFAGTLKEVKNPECFVDAAIKVLKSGLACRFIIAGDGPLREALESKVRAQGLETAFEFLGQLPPKQVPYQQADVVVSTSWREGSSNTLLEAMAHGVAVVGTDVGGTHHLLGRGDVGVLVEPGNVEAVASAIASLLRDTDLRRRLGSNGLNLIRSEYSVDQMVVGHLDLYAELLEQGT